LGRIARGVARARITLAALKAGARAAVGHLSRGTTPEAAR
jgi:hypothetical protein